MLLKISEMPSDVKLCKILTYDKIKQKSSFIDNFPKPGELISDKIVMIPETAMSEAIPKPLISEALKNACWRMVRACLTDDGVGLAAPQIGIMKRLFIIRHDKEHFKVYFHPQFNVESDSVPCSEIEGCLSVPGRRILVERNSKILAEWIDVVDNKFVHRSELLEGFPARVFQHEHDHLLGISIIDREKMQKSAK